MNLLRFLDEVYSAWDAKESGIRREESWNQLFEDYSSENPSLASELKRAISGELPVGVEDIIYSFIQETAKRTS